MEHSTLDEIILKFKLEYKEKGNRDPLYQVLYLSELAYRYQKKHDWASLLRAHTLYNSCAVRDAEHQKKWQEKAYHVQTDYWKSNLQSFSQCLHVTQTLKAELKEIREKGRRQTSRISEHFSRLNCSPGMLTCPENQQLYKQITQDIPPLSSSLNQDMILFTQLVVEKALDICGPPTIKYCVVALGSMARGEATPYSDLEFMFLLESKSSNIMTHFQQLALTIYFLIGNLCETKLKVMAIPELMIWDDVKQRYVGHWFDDVVMNGFKIDGLGSWAGNIPTGGTLEQNNQFICTPAELAAKYKAIFDNPHPQMSLSGDLTAMLANTAFISGDQSLHDEFTSLIATRKPNKQRQQANARMLIRDAKKFNFTPNLDLTHTRQLKIDVYRYPSILLLNLKIIHGLQNCDPWEIINQLEARQILWHQTANCLRFSLSCALFIRLSAYFYHDSQNDHISVLSSVADCNSNSRAWYVRPELLIHMFIHLEPLKVAISKSAGNVSDMIVVYLTDRSRYKMVALVRYYSHEPDQVTSFLRSAYPEGLESAEGFYQQIYIYSAIESSSYNEAEKLLMKRMQSGDYDEYDFCLLGRLYRKQSLFSQALDSYRIRLGMLISLHGFTDHVEIACCYSQIGIVLHDLSRYSEALVEYRKCLDMRLRMYGEVDNVEISSVICNIGIALQYQSKYEEALTEFRKCLSMHKKVHGDRDHKEIASVLYNMASVLQDQSRYREALDEYNKCLDMRYRLYGDRDHEDIANVLGSIGIIQHKQSEYTKALKSYRKTLDMRSRLCDGRDHVQIADMFCNIGNTLYHQSKITEALEHYNRCLEMRLRIYGSEKHVDVAAALCNIGNVLFGQRQYDQALIQYRKCLGIYSQALKDINHMKIADIRCNIGVILKNKGKYAEALCEYDKCLNMYRSLYGYQDHSAIADVYCNIGNLLSNQANYTEALIEYDKCLDMRQRIYGPTDHCLVAEILYNIGNVLRNQGKYKEALVKFKSSLDMFVRVFGNVNHSSIAIVRETIRSTKNQL